MLHYSAILYSTIVLYYTILLPYYIFSFRKVSSYFTMWPPFPLLSLCINRTLKSGPRWWSITSPAVVNSPVTAPFPSMPGRSGAWSPVWRRSLPLMILAKPRLPPLHCSSPRGPTTKEKPCSFFTVYCGIISLHYWPLYNLYYFQFILQ